MRNQYAVPKHQILGSTFFVAQADSSLRRVKQVLCIEVQHPDNKYDAFSPDGVAEDHLTNLFSEEYVRVRCARILDVVIFEQK